jgi:predicted transglutaminase-like cysteine proteinase
METTLASALLAVLAFGLGLGCASLAGEPVRYTYFEQPVFDDAWSSKISAWQNRELADHGGAAVAETSGVSSPAAVPAAAAEPPAQAEPDAGSAEEQGPEGDLRAKYARFRAERKRQMARDVASWIQSQARSHYVPDGPVDHWATLEETLESDGDDCDGLELLTFHSLRELGFGPHEVYRAIVVRPEDGQHHMVTLWFETPDDPWVIDPTGAMTLGMPRMSDMPAWVPLKVFSESAEYTAERARKNAESTRLAVNE